MSHKEFVKEDIANILNEGYDDLGGGVWKRKVKDQPLTEPERALAIVYLRQMSRPNGGIPRFPRKPGDPLADLMGKYLKEIGWKPGAPLPKHLIYKEDKLMAICLALFVVFILLMIFGAMGGSRPH